MRAVPHAGAGLRDIVRRIEDGESKPDDLDRVERVARGLADVDAFTWNVICYFGISVSWPAVSFTRKFRPEFEAHLIHGGCRVLPRDEATVDRHENYAWPHAADARAEDADDLTLSLRRARRHP